MNTLYAHKYHVTQSEFVKYRGNTNQIDVIDSIIGILAAKPGARFIDVAKLIYPEDLSISRGYVHERLQAMSEAGTIIRNGFFYYLPKDALNHDVTMVRGELDKLAEHDVDHDKASFLAAGMVMGVEKRRADEAGRDFDPMKTKAYGALTDPVEEDLDDENVFEEDDSPVENPFDGMSDEAYVELIEESAAADAEAEAAQVAEALAAEKDALLSEVKSAADLIGRTVEIERAEAPVGTGKVLEMMSDGVLFSIINPVHEDFSAGEVTFIPYNRGLKYQLMVPKTETV